MPRILNVRGTYSREAYRSKRAKRIDKMDRSCQRCSEAIPFERSAHAKYCSDDCNYQAAT